MESNTPHLSLVTETDHNYAAPSQNSNSSNSTTAIDTDNNEPHTVEINISVIVQHILQQNTTNNADNNVAISDRILFRIMKDSILSPQNIAPGEHLALVNRE